MKTFLLLLCFLSASPALAQTVSSDVQWVKIVSPARDFSASVPAGFLVDNEERDFSSLRSRLDNASVSITIYRDANPKYKLSLHRSFNRTKGEKVSRFKIGSFDGDVRTRDKELFGMSIFMASKKAYYVLSVSADTSKHPVLTRFLDSVRLDGQPLSKQAAPVDDAEPGVVLSDLQTSPEIVEALKMTNPGEIEIEYARGSEPETTPIQPAGILLTRPLTILRKPKAPYTEEARWRGVQGSVRLKVLFKAEGYIGSIKVMNKLTGGLTESAIRAAKQIKFLPKMVNGRPVDTTENFDFSFNIH